MNTKCNGVYFKTINLKRNQREREKNCFYFDKLTLNPQTIDFLTIKKQGYTSYVKYSMET
jgi:hypothetical protein